MAERLDIVSQSNFPTNKSNTVEIVTTTKKKVTTASASDIATLVTPAISNLDIATQTNFPIQESDAQSDFIITTDGGVNNVTAEAAAGLISSYIPTGGGGDPHEPDFTEDYSTNYSDFSNFTGSGTEADPYQIWNEKMFLNARFKVNNGGITANTYFKLMRDFVWQFDGLGFGTFLETFTIYDANNQSLGTASYGSSTYQSKLFFDGGNCTITINNNGFVFNDAFIANTLGVTEYDHFSTTRGYALLFNCKKISNLNINFTGQPLTTTDTRPWDFMVLGYWITYLAYGGEVKNCKVENLKLNTGRFYFGDSGIIAGTMDGCIVRNFEMLANSEMSGPCLCAHNTKISNCIVENVNIYHGYIIMNSYLGGTTGAIVDNCIVRNIRFRISPSDARYQWACCVYSVIVKNTKIEDVFAGNKQSIRLFNLSQYSSDTSKTVTFNNNSVKGNINGFMGNANQNFFAVYFPNSQSGCKFESNNFLCDALFNVDQGSNNFTIDTTNHNWFSPLDAEVATLNDTIVNGKLTTVANL